MKLINFDAEFQRYMTDWAAENAARYGHNVDRMEEKMPEVYLAWLNTPQDFLSGETPGTYFAKYEDAAALVRWMEAYMAQKVPVPDQLLERIADLGNAAEAPLLAVLEDGDAPLDAQLTAISLLSEIESNAPMTLYIQWLAQSGEKDDRADLAADALSAMGRQVVAPLLSAAAGASPYGRMAMLDVLVNFPGEEAIFTLAREMFLAHPERRALFASLLGKLGDARALPLLLDALEDVSLHYLDYLELRNAVEALGGDAPPERTFEGDPYYESLRRME